MDTIRNYSAIEFEETALEIFRRQAENISVYRKFVELLNIDPPKVNKIKDIPFLPIELFKHHRIVPENIETWLMFESSGTTGQEKSKHYIVDKKLYEKSIREGFRFFYGKPEDYVFLALLPSYLERKNASLAYMVNYLMELSGHPDNGFYLNDYEQLIQKLRYLKRCRQKTLLIGVSFALLEFAEMYSEDFSMFIFMETGGMKGRREEITREELHNKLSDSFNFENVHSEYGMTELLSQAYSKGNGMFQSPPWMKILIRDSHDPFCYSETGNSGLINIIDFANIHSCSFIATSDIGRTHDDGSFEVLGRMDNSDIRGCNLLVS